MLALSLTWISIYVIASSNTTTTSYSCVNQYDLSTTTTTSYSCVIQHVFSATSHYEYIYDANKHYAEVMASNSSNKNKRKSRAHQGRHLQIASTKADKRIAEFPDQSLCIKSGSLYCQACDKGIADKKSDVERHCGLYQPKKPNSKTISNTGAVHKGNYEKWIARDVPQTDYSDVKSGWIKASMMNGLNAKQTAGMARDFFGDFPIENGGTIPTYSQGLVQFVFSAVINTLFEEYHYDHGKQEKFRKDCVSLQKHLYKYYSTNLAESHPTMMFFKDAAWFNIDRTVPKPQHIKDATKATPWGYKYYEGNIPKSKQLQNEWTGYITDDIPACPDDVNIFENGERCLVYWMGKKYEWPLLSYIAIRILLICISTADVERIFSIYNYYLGRLDAVNLGPKNKKCRAYILQNKQFL